MGFAALAFELVSACALVRPTPVIAASVVWNLNLPSGEQGTTDTLTSVSGGFTIGTAGFTYTGSLTGSHSFTAVDLYGKNGGGDETGLGLGNTTGLHPHLVDPTRDHEIVTGSLIRIDTTAAQAAGVGNFQFSFGSTTQGEEWSVYGSTAANTGLASLYSKQSDEGTHSLSPYDFYYFVYDGPPLKYGSTWWLQCIAGHIHRQSHWRRPLGFDTASGGTADVYWWLKRSCATLAT